MHVFKIVCLFPAKQDLRVASKNIQNIKEHNGKQENTEVMQDKPGIRTVHKITQGKPGKLQS